MNRYQCAMGYCAPPEALEERLKARVLERPAVGNKRPVRPAGLGRKALIAAMLALALTACAGAVAVVEWDDIFDRYFGESAAGGPVAETLFQKVGVSARCDDVTLTVREAVGDGKAIHIILDYQLPEGAGEKVQSFLNDQDGSRWFGPDIFYLATGELTYEDVRDIKDLRNSYTAGKMSKYRFGAQRQTRVVEFQGYDPETRTLTYHTYLFNGLINTNINDQPLTLVVGPLEIVRGDTELVLVDHPALISFQPEYSARAYHMTHWDAETFRSVQVFLSPLSISVSTTNMGYCSDRELAEDTWLVRKDGSEFQVHQASDLWNEAAPAEPKMYSRFSEMFHKEFLDLSQVHAVRVGGVELRLKDTK